MATPPASAAPAALPSRALEAARRARGLARRARSLAPARGARALEKAAGAEAGALERATEYKDIVGRAQNLCGLEAQLAAAEACGRAGLLGGVEVACFSGALAGEEVADGAGARSVVVDVVASGGGAWIECKWSQNAHDAERLASQVAAYVACARRRRNWDGAWRVPRVVVKLAGAELGQQGVQKLLAAGAHAVVQPEGDLVAVLPPPPVPPARAVLCLTSLCALVSAISHGAAQAEGDEQHEQLRLLKERRPDWYEVSVNQERASPILPQLDAALEGKELYVTRHILSEFETVMERSGGESERERWAALRKRLAVTDAESPVAAAVCRDRLATGSKGNWRNALSIFSASEALHACCVTANGKAARSLANAGLGMPTFIHRPVCT